MYGGGQPFMTANRP